MSVSLLFVTGNSEVVEGGGKGASVQKRYVLTKVEKEGGEKRYEVLKHSVL